MKVIGEGTGAESFIVHVSRDELANMMGFYSSYSPEFIEQRNLALAGNVVDISKIYRNYYKVKALIERAPYDKAITKLEEMIEAIKPIDELIKEVSKKYETD